MAMNKRHLSLAAVVLGASGCGLEALFFGSITPEHQLVVSKVTGTTDTRVTKVSFVKADGVAVEVIAAEVKGGSFAISLPTSEYTSGRVVAEAGELRLEAVVPFIPKDGATDGVTVDVASTTSALVVDAWLSAKDRGLPSVETKVLTAQLKNLAAGYVVDGAPKELRQMVDRVLAAADVGASTRVIRAPSYDASFAAKASTLDEAWLLAKNLDYTGDMQPDTSSSAFDLKLGEVARGISLDGCYDPVKIRVVFEVDFNDGHKDGNCDAIDRFKWVKDEPGKSMFFIGGVHMDSTIQDSEIDAMLGNTGGWVPNQIHMYDDGTNGDATSGDNIWTVSFVLPVGLRMGYKYTWGTAGAIWTGSEEWPGNQHILEIVDVNGDHFVLRRDNFGDEATNKDKVNLYRRGRGQVTWDTDANADGIPDARERPIDTNNDCSLDEWVTPTGIGPATVDCESSSG